ncbi:uncharacterized protein LOC142559614 [Dermacentor variabilis]|uniref:uncharacterized protein LOC142559614 n=1 Tax=Dermacentor variabilis TaxID=34621 RepID=UPI003F5B1463
MRCGRSSKVHALGKCCTCFTQSSIRVGCAVFVQRVRRTNGTSCGTVPGSRRQLPPGLTRPNFKVRCSLQTRTHNYGPSSRPGVRSKSPSLTTHYKRAQLG